MYIHPRVYFIFTFRETFQEHDTNLCQVVGVVQVSVTQLIFNVYIQPGKVNYSNYKHLPNMCRCSVEGPGLESVGVRPDGVDTVEFIG